MEKETKDRRRYKEGAKAQKAGSVPGWPLPPEQEAWVRKALTPTSLEEKIEKLLDAYTILQILAVLHSQLRNQHARVVSAIRVAISDIAD